MFPRYSFVMLLISAIMLIAASLIKYFIGDNVNLWILGAGLVFLIYSTAMLFFFKKK